MKDLRNAHTITVEEMAAVLKIGRTKAYQFINSNPPFTVIPIDSKLKRITTKSFFAWLDGKETRDEDPKHLA